MKHGLQGIGNLYANIFFIEFFLIQPLHCTIYIYFAMRLKQKNSLWQNKKRISLGSASHKHVTGGGGVIHSLCLIRKTTILVDCESSLL